MIFLTAAAAACSPLRGIFVVRALKQHCLSCDALSHMQVLARSFLFLLLFFFLAKKKRRGILAKQRSKRQRIMSTACTSNRQKACVASTGKGNYGVCKPRRTARATSDSAGRFHGVFPRAVLPSTSKYHRANHEKTHLTAVRCVFSGIEYIKLLERCHVLLFPHQDICAGIDRLHLLRIDRLQKADVQRGVPVIR